ncbi:hypothetical protein [Nonomuraea dietziae]|uniref:hypothetical protein n=1 Tax=Nonomuraea dietziae TaxID=65515 RepID=UPI0031DF81E2
MYTCGRDRLPVRARREPALVPVVRLIRRILERQRVRMVVCQNITDVGHLVDDAEIA